MAALLRSKSVFTHRGPFDVCVSRIAERVPAASLMMEYVLQLLRRDVTRGVAGTILLKVGSGGLAFAMFSLAARTMSADAFGLFATWLCIAQIASVIGLVGQELVLVRFLNEYQ